MGLHIRGDIGTGLAHCRGFCKKLIEKGEPCVRAIGYQTGGQCCLTCVAEGIKGALEFERKKVST